MVQQLPLLITYVVLIIIPIAPAYLLFKALPSSANVSGPLQGLGLKLGGAFAGYFALLVFTFTQLQQIRRFITPEMHQVWTVEGNLQDDQGNGVLVGPCEVHFMPEPYDSTSGGWFKTTFVTNLSQGGLPDFPHLSIGHSGFPAKDIPLDPVALEQQSLEEKLNEIDHAIVLKTIVLKKPLEPYNPATNHPPQEVNPATYLEEIGKSRNGGGGGGGQP